MELSTAGATGVWPAGGSPVGSLKVTAVAMFWGSGFGLVVHPDADILGEVVGVEVPVPQAARVAREQAWVTMVVHGPPSVSWTAMATELPPCHDYRAPAGGVPHPLTRCT